jgi:hypothetical protein
MKCEDEPGSWVNYFQKLLKKRCARKPCDKTHNNAD